MTPKDNAICNLEKQNSSVIINLRLMRFDFGIQDTRPKPKQSAIYKTFQNISTDLFSKTFQQSTHHYLSAQWT